MTILTSLLGTKAFGLLLLLQEAAASPEASGADHFTLTEMVKNMGGVAIAVVVVLLIMSVYSIAIMVERYLTYSAAKKQSREFAPRVAQALKNDRIADVLRCAPVSLERGIGWDALVTTAADCHDQTQPERPAARTGPAGARCVVLPGSFDMVSL